MEFLLAPAGKLLKVGMIYSKTRMTTFIKAKLNNSDDHTNIEINTFNI